MQVKTTIRNHLIPVKVGISQKEIRGVDKRVEKLGTLSAKMSIPLIIFIMFPIVILILAPGAMRVLPNVF